MASPYALPSSALPHAHQHHIHSHSHSHSQSQPSINSWKSSMSNGGLHAHPEDQDSDHEHRHSHSRPYSHGRTGSNTRVAMSNRKAPPAALDTMNGWARETTAGGKSVITPMTDTATTPLYSPSKQHHHHRNHHDHGHDHDHDHDHTHDHYHHNHHGHDQSAERSFFTKMLLPYTAPYPLIHAIMTEKDSRRIFYFMVYVGIWDWLIDAWLTCCPD